MASREALRSEMGNMPVEYDLGRLPPELGELAALPPEARERALRHSGRTTAMPFYDRGPVRIARRFLKAHAPMRAQRAG